MVHFITKLNHAPFSGHPTEVNTPEFCAKKLEYRPDEGIQMASILYL
jgi:hypothetical protein